MTAILFLLPSITLATQPVVADTVLSIDEVVIRASSSPEVSPVQRLQGTDLQRLQSHSVADALRFFAGVQLKDYGGVGGIKTINVRSMGSTHIGVSFDGLPVGNAQNGQVDLGQFSLDNLGCVELSNGQKSALLQSAADFNTAAALHLHSRRPSFAAGRRIVLRTAMRGGSFGMFSPSLSLSSRLSDRLSATLSADVLRSDGRYPFRYRRLSSVTGETVYDTTAIRENGDIRSLRVEAALFGRWGFADLMTKGYIYRSRRGIPGAIVSNVWHRGERQDDDTRFLQTTVTFKPTEEYSSRLLAKAARYDTHYVNRDTTMLPVDNEYRQSEFYLSSAHALRSVGPLSLSGAIDIRYNGMTADLYAFAKPQRMTLMAACAAMIEHNEVRAMASCVLTYVADKVSGRANPSRHTVATPALIVSWKPQSSEVLTVRAFVKQSFRMPTFNDLYYADMGNARLKAEKALQANVGLTLHSNAQRSCPLMPQLRMTADLYHNRVSNKIVAFPKGTQFRWTMLNLGHVDISGADVAGSAQWHFSEMTTADVKAQYSFQRAVDITNPSDSYYRHQIPYLARHSGSLRSSLSVGGWCADVAFVYTGGRYSAQENNVYNYVQPWYTTDASLHRTFYVGKVKLRLSFEANNVFDQAYDVIINYPMPGRNYRGAISIDI